MAQDKSIGKLIFWSAVSVVGTGIISHYFGKPIIDFIDGIIKKSPDAGTFIYPTKDNATINLIREGDMAVVSNYTNLPIISTSETQLYFNPFTENVALVGRYLPNDTKVGLLTGKFATWKGITYAEVVTSSKALGWVNINNVTTIK